MKVTYNWLKAYVDFSWSPEELTDRLTMLGLEVEGVQKLGGEFAGIVVAQVLSRDKHPNADKLSKTRGEDYARITSWIGDAALRWIGRTR